jgi:hypothetical protein
MKAYNLVKFFIDYKHKYHCEVLYIITSIKLIVKFSMKAYNLVKFFIDYKHKYYHEILYIITSIKLIVKFFISLQA